MSRRWDSVLGSPLEFFDGVDAVTEPDTPVVLEGTDFACSRNAAACLEAHLRVRKLMLDRGVGPEGVIIMEDDVAPIEGKCIFEEVQNARKHYPGLEILLLHLPFTYEKFAPGRGGVMFPRVGQSVKYTGTQLLWHSKEGLENYLKCFSKRLQIADGFGFVYPSHNGKFACLQEEAVVRFKETGSSIGYGLVDPSDD